MRLRLKVALATLALMIGYSLAIARTPQQSSSADQFQARPDGFGAGDPVHRRGPDEPRRGRRDFGGRWGQREWRGMGDRGAGPREFGLSRLLSNPNVRQQLGVTADQAAKIRQQESDFQKAEIRNRADLEIKRMDLNDLLSADKPDRAAVDSKLQEISAAQLAVEKSAVDYRFTMRDALTSAQRQKLQQLMTQQRRQQEPSGSARPGGSRGGGRGGRGAGSAPNAQGQTPNQ